MKTTLFPVLPKFLQPALRVLPLTALLAACGGGGSDGPPATPQTPPTPDTDRPITEMPVSSYTGDKLEAFMRLNQARLAAGVSAVEQNAQLDAAAQAHATYQVRNYRVGHGEDPGKPWFTGVDHRARARAQGYSGTTVVEVISYARPGVDAIESLLQSVYHLHGVLEPRANQIGIGSDSTSTPAPLSSTSITMGTSGRGLLTLGSVWHWPVDGQADVNPIFYPANESPNPAPDLESAGTPIMFCGAEGDFAPLRVIGVALQERESGASIPARLLVNERVQAEAGSNIDIVVDPNLALSSVYQGCVFLLPTTELQYGKTYQVSVHAEQAGKDISTDWRFETRSANPALRHGAKPLPRELVAAGG